MIDAFLVFFLVSLIPIAFLGIGGPTEAALFTAWRWLQVVTFLGASAWVLYQLARRDWRGLVVLLLLALVVAYFGLSYSGIAWDAQIEYHRVLLLAIRYGGLTEGYRHGVVSWVLGYPPGTSLSVAFYRSLHLLSPNVAQELLFLLWSGAFFVRHLRHVDLPGKLLFFAIILVDTRFLWHLTYFYNNLFYALIWAELALAPLFGSPMRPWETCGSALVLVWLRPQWEIAAIPIATGALATLLASPTWTKRLLRDAGVVTAAALVVARLAASYWQNAVGELGRLLNGHTVQVLDQLRTHPDFPALHVDVDTKAFMQQAPHTPALLSKESANAVAWAYHVSVDRYPLYFAALAALALLALVTLRRRGLAFLAPMLGPFIVMIGTAVFARSVASYQANEWALERLQIIVPILAAGVATALHQALRERRVS